MNTEYLHILCPPIWSILPPLGISYLFSFLKSTGVRAAFYDLNAFLYRESSEDIKKRWTLNKNISEEDFFNFYFLNYYKYFEEILNLIENLKVEVVGFSLFNINRYFTFKTISFLKKKFPFLKIIVGGPETFRFYIENSFDYSLVDCYVVGEGEKGLLEFFKDKEKKLFIFDSFKELNFFPDFKDFDLSLYRRKKALPVMFGRGCINKCNFCAERLLFKPYKFHSVNIMNDMISFYKKEYGINAITFYDSMLNANLNMFDRLLDVILPFNIKWDAQIAIRKDMEEEIFYKMKESGCINLFIGLEAGSDSLLKKMGKNFSIKDAINFFKILNKAKIYFEVSLIIGYPDETEEEFNETLNFLRENKGLIPKIAQVSIFKNYPGINARKITKEEEYVALKRFEIIADFLEKNGFNYTSSYLNNLI